jgi:hypothetical protein
MPAVRAIPTLSDNTCAMMAQQWTTSGMLPQLVRVVPYKVSYLSLQFDRIVIPKDGKM